MGVYLVLDLLGLLLGVLVVVVEVDKGLHIVYYIFIVQNCHMTENTQLNNIISFLFYIITNFLILNSCCLLL